MMPRLIFILVALLSTPTVAQEYVLSHTPAQRSLPPCSSGNWSLSFNSGTDTYRCQNGKVDLSSNDTIRATDNSILSADDGFSFDGGNTVGNATYTIDLEANYGSFDWSESSNTLYGRFDADSTTVSLEDVEMTGGIITGGDIVLEDSDIGGAVRSDNNKVELKGTEVTGSVYANGDITIEESSKVTGSVTTPNNKVTVKESEVVGDIESNGDLTIEDSNITGDLTSTNNKVTVKDSDVYGEVNANGEITIEGSVVIGDLTSTNNHIKLEDGSEVIGDVTAGQPNWGTVYVNDGSTVDGTCLYQQSPANSCGVTPLPDPIAKYHLEESTWNGTANEVQDESGNNLHGRAINGALTATSTPALPAIDNMGTCGYGYFEHDSNQYVEVADNNLLDLNKTLTVSAWIYPTSKPNSGLFSIFSKDTNFELHLDSNRRIYWWWQEKNSSTRNLTSSSTVPLNDWTFVTIRYDSKKSKASLFINGELRASRSSNQNKQLQTNSNPFQIGQDQNYSGRAFDGAIDEVQIFDEALTEQQIRQLYRQRHTCDNTPTLQCFSDDFSSGSLSSLWVTSTSSGSFQPGIVSSRLRFTQAVQNQATSSTYQRLFPAKDNLVEIEFDHFAYNGSGADGIAVVLSDALVTPRAGAFGGPLGYGFKTNEPGFAGGWLGVGLDEYGNFSNEGGQGSDPGRRRQSVALRGSGVDETGYRYLAGACNNGQTNQNGDCLSPTVDDNNSGAVHRYKIVVDSRVTNESQVEISRKIGNGSWQSIVGPINVLDSQYNQAAVPDDFLLSITGSTGSVTNIHEIDNFQVCALNSRPIEDQIDHFRITHTGQGVTCNESEVTIRACKDSSCTEEYTDTVTATLSPATVPGGGGWVGGNVKTFSGGSGTFYIRKNQPGTLTLDVTGSTPPAKPFSSNLCDDGSGLSENNCDMVFSDSGFVIDVPDKYGAETVTATIKAVKQGDSATQCVPSFANVTKSVDLWSQYLDPVEGADLIGQPKVSVESTEIGINESDATNFNLSFNSSGQASVNLNYDDAGHMQLNAKFNGTGDEQGLELTGSGNFISAPKYLTVSAENTSGGTGVCSSADTSCSVFAKAGENFTLKVTAYNQDDEVTPNYKHSGITITHSLVEPSTGSTGSISTTSYNHVPILNGTNSVTQSVSEVGVFNFTVDPPSSFYGKTTKPITSSSTGNIGRFTPAYFELPATSTGILNTPVLLGACSQFPQFSYIGQSFGYSTNPALTLNPKAVDGSDIENYVIGNWWRYSNSWGSRNYIADNGLTIALDPTASPSVTRTPSDENIMVLNNEMIFYTKETTPINPFTASFQLVLTASDVTDSDGVCLKSNDSGACQGITFENVDDTMQLRWGRLLINDTYGSEIATVRQRLELQHYQNDRFETNTDDSCTSFGAIGNFVFTSGEYTVVDSGSPTQPEVNASLVSATASGGESWIEFTPPGSGSYGTITTSLNVNSLFPWLRDDEDDDGNFESTASGLTQFGLYRGSDRVIWWNEQN
ncbi:MULTISPECIES: DUF6701 domain-containing protein [Vibrio]|uniref:DUF6701 domain-containing protein n=1 Tax=Vibrio TaxID=662 RepID=UPI002075648A|nr:MULTISPECIES: DUF6701 domain-containing protein [Vibrio]USD32879.1 polymer-forming cytoskeletal protein [Vibrio sp. SCSIO 43186]USD45919.1 polymer-forming cytoskeletal protein [Vibrio sp. SCSIO 43145]USD70004.1 polymer-forming cytoskeletal protein [Vibrio sp. SCSIO 43139]USD94912.1 MSHA biogenesis protein MshQ [Vibrio coralliilyticus]